MEVKLIAIDIDGTLLDNDHQLHPRNEAAIQVAVQEGVQVILATGRMRSSCEWIIDQLGLQTPGIFIQGLHIADSQGRRIYGDWLDTAVLNHFLGFADEYSLSFVAFADHEILTLRRDMYTDLVAKYETPALIEVEDVTAVPIHKLIIFSEPARIQDVRPSLAEHMRGRADVLITQPEMLEIMPTGTSKGSGLAWLSESIGIPLAETMAIGNAENDIEMLRLAGLSVAVGNAMEAVKEVSTHQVASNNEAGVAEAIERFVFS